ncbi:MULTISPECIES: winged helix-turn-helix domain-containing protein [Subtercola]|uniref:Winged helix family transcriptional regulator n=1 Tax=Subtercola vilae TaxID=2056433 RepID=A0A4T2BW93_9MICO|nr:MULTISPECIES: winged helix-turn-helix domain-containing protein [Subtercola]MEA9985604.1 winged helix-turn-helix domain-containing protein [Subtercola sp. RTI3]TIH34831.1 winged helix family transcriptional regulator [Subtercola vilae]
MTNADENSPPNEQPETRGFAVYVGIDEFRALADGTTLVEMAAELKALVHRIAPSAETFASIAVAPSDAGGRDLDVVKSATRHVDESPVAGGAGGGAGGVGRGAPGLGSSRSAGEQSTTVIDLSRRRIVIGTQVTTLTASEFDLLRTLVENEGQPVGRRALVHELSSSDTDDSPNFRTIDVHVRRLRVKLGTEADLVRTVHGVGYVFNRGSNVLVRHPNGVSR